MTTGMMNDAKGISDRERVEFIEQNPAIAVDDSGPSTRYALDATNGPWFDSVREAIDHAINERRGLAYSHEHLAAMMDRYERAYQHVGDLCAGKRKWIMSIPPQEGYDSDLVITESLDDIPKLVDAIRFLLKPHRTLPQEVASSLGMAVLKGQERVEIPSIGVVLTTTTPEADFDGSSSAQ